MNKDFTGEVSTYNKDEFNILAPGEQFWDGLTPEEKAGKVLVVPKHKKDVNGNIDYKNYENLVIEKKDKNGQGLNGIQFCIAKDPKDITKGCNEKYDYSNWITKDGGKLEIPTNELPLYKQTLIETGETIKNYKPQKIVLYVDPGNRFLGEVKGKNERGEEVFITYENLLNQITDNGKTSVGDTLSLGSDIDTGGNWLKIYDARVGKTIYIAKKPLTNNVSWKMLYKAGVVYGLDQIAINKIQPNGVIKQEAPYTGEAGYKPKIIKIKDSNGIEKKYIVRLLKGHNTNTKLHKNGDPNTITLNNIEFKMNITKDSEWNRYILPIVKDYRYGLRSYWRIEDGLKYLNDDSKQDLLRQPSLSKEGKNYKIQLAEYNWFGDLTLRPLESSFCYKGKIVQSSKYDANSDVGQFSWTQEYPHDSSYRTFRGGNSIDCGAAYISYNTYYHPYANRGFRPVLEEIN